MGDKFFMAKFETLEEALQFKECVEQRLWVKK
jgi:hypothetical protein